MRIIADDFLEALDWAAQYVEEMFLLEEIKTRRVAVFRILADCFRSDLKEFLEDSIADAIDEMNLEAAIRRTQQDTPPAHQPALVPLVGAETTGDLPASEGAAPTSSKATSILDPRFRYTPAAHTDVAKTFARVRERPLTVAEARRMFEAIDYAREKKP